MGLILLPLVVLGAPNGNLLENAGFDDGLAGWQNNAPHVSMTAVSEGKRTTARIVVPDSVAVAWPHLYQEVKGEPGDVFEGRVEALGKDIRHSCGAYTSFEFYNADGKRLSFAQSGAATGDRQWNKLELRSVVPPDAVAIRFCLILHGHGEAYFDNAHLARIGNINPTPLTGPVTLTVTDEVVCPSLLGFGAEDDGWFYAPANTDRGVTEEDVKLREARIEWMDPDWTRMFFWHKDWNPSGDWETFTFDSPNMQSHYRTLDLYQRLGAVVNATGVEWGVQDPYGQPEKVAKAIGALFEHLIRTKGYTCVQEWTLSNEPNGAFASGMGYSFDRFVELHTLVKQEFARRGLAIRIVGSDDTAGFPWFTRCVKNDTYFQTADFFASHRYLQYPDRVLAPFFFDCRLNLLAERQPRKPFVVAEFGFQDARSGTLENPIMESYPYAVWTAAFIIEGLNRGVAGFSIWCMHEVYYPGGGFMNYGLWDFKDNAWKPRPVYHAIAAFTRLTERGDRVRKCVSTHPQHVLGAVVGSTLFWVNRADGPTPIRVENFELHTIRIMTEATLDGDRECGALEQPSANGFTGPPQSFGYAR